MSPASILASVSGPEESQQPEQRSCRRYPIALNLQYKLINKTRVTRLGSGKTLNLSSSGIFFKAKEPIPEEGQIELVVNWPFLLDGACPLNLVARGRIVRSSSNGTSVEMTYHELRTGKRRIASS